MYQKYPLAIILLYYEVPTEQVWKRQQTEFRNLLSECCDYFVSRHGKLNLIVNTTEKIGAKNFCTIPAMEPCISGEFFARGMDADALLSSVLRQQVAQIGQWNRKDLKMMPIYLVVIRQEGTEKEIVAPLSVPEKHLKRSYFTVSYRTGSVQMQKGGTEQMKAFLKHFFREEISLPLAKVIASKEYDTAATPQEFFSLEGERNG